MDRNKNYYHYTFSNGERHAMTPVEAHRYAERHMLKVYGGPGYVKGKREKDWDGWGFHDGLQMSFKGPKHYRDYLKANGMVEASVNDKPVEQVLKRPIWDEDLIRKAVAAGVLTSGDGILIDALLRGDLDYPEDGMVIDCD